VHPYQQADDEKMLDMIERGQWPGWKSAVTWGKVSDSAKDLVRSMMNPNAKERLTVNACLEHPWIQGNAPKDDLGDIKDALKSYQAKKKMRAAVLGVMATNKMKMGLLSLANQPQTATPTTTPTPTVVTQQPVVEVKITNQPKVQQNTSDYTTLTLKVVSGSGLASKDANGKSDPFCCVWCGPMKFKTKVKPKTLTPVWDETFIFPHSKCHDKVIDIECWDVNVLMRDEFMGEFAVDYKTLPVGETLRKSYKLQSSREKKKKGMVSGEIVLELTKNK
jgi:serine/threonine protein kinase